MKITKTEDIQIVAEFLTNSIINQLNAGKKVVWFATGGSAIAVASLASKSISKVPHDKLVVMLTDERYGSLHHPDSNWQQLLNKGFDLPEAKLIPILTGDNRDETVEKFKKNLETELNTADYKIGLFGVGSDGHTAGILPGSPAVDSTDLAFGYDSEKFERITMTPRAIKMLDEIVVYMQGEVKWPVIDDLREKDLPLSIQPAQILKSAPLSTVFSDYNK